MAETPPDVDPQAADQTNITVLIEHDEIIKNKIRKKEIRKIRARKRRQNSIWFGLGMIGTLGWMVVLPIVLGIVIGIWLDELTNSQLPWTLILLLSGVFIGCFNAVRWIMQEQKEIERERKERNHDV
jgi:ATP synthase protein I